MDKMKFEMKKWIADLCNKDKESETVLRTLLLEDKKIIREINISYIKNNVSDIQSLITQFMDKKNINIVTCRYCNTTNVITKDSKCKQCERKLNAPNKLGLQRLCLYCNKPVSSIANSITCNLCKNNY